MSRRSGARSWAIDCDISQQPRRGGAKRMRSTGLAAIGRWWCHAVSPKSLISSAGFSAVHTDHSSGIAASSEILHLCSRSSTLCATVDRLQPCTSLFLPSGPVLRAKRWVHFSRWIAIIVHELTTPRRFATHTYTRPVSHTSSPVSRDSVSVNIRLRAHGLLSSLRCSRIPL